MGANQSYSMVVNRVVNENIANMNCTSTDSVDQNIDAQFGDLNLSGNCNFEVSNNSVMESNCDMTATFAALSSQETIAEIEQTASAGGAVNAAHTNQQNITQNMNSIIQSCQPGTVTRQTLKNIYGDIDCSGNASFNLGNHSKIEANCLLAAAARVDSQQSARTSVTQTVKGLLDGIFGPIIMIVGGVIGLIIFFVALSFIPKKKDD